MEWLVKVFVEKDGYRKFVHLPVDWKPDEEDLVGYVVADLSNTGDSCRQSVRFISDDAELAKMDELSRNVPDLNRFLKEWTTLDLNQKRTVVALTENYGGDWEEHIEAAKSGEAFVTDVVYYPFDESASDKGLGEYYFERWHSDSTIATTKLGFGTVENYIDYEKFGRDVRLNGCDGFWSDLYGRWVSVIN